MKANALAGEKLGSGLRITRTDGAVYGFSDQQTAALIGGVTYAASMLDISGIVIAANAAVGNLELTTLHDESVFTTADILGEVWENAAFLIFRYDTTDLSAAVDSLLAGTLGNIRLRDNTVVAELRDLRQYLQASVGAVSSKTCRYRLGSSDENDGGLCMIDLDGSPSLRATVTLTQVTSNQVFRVSALSVADDWFGEGEIEWLTGANAGQMRKVKSFERGSPVVNEFTLALPMFSTVGVGDTAIVTPGCRKRFLEDCVGKFGNGPNFGGEPHRKGTNDLTKPPTVDV